MNHRNTIYYDISDLMVYAPLNSTLSGIQRLTLMTLTKLANMKIDYDLRVLVYDASSRKALAYSPELFSGEYNYDQIDFCYYFNLKKPKKRLYKNDIDSYIHKKYGKSFKGLFHKYRLKILNYITSGQKYGRIGLSNIELKNQNKCSATGSRHVALFQAGDVIYIPGAMWDIYSHDNFVKEAKKQGVYIIQFIHDLIPIIAPEFVLDYTPELFSRWIDSISSIADGFIVNSQATKSDLMSYMESNGKNDIPCEVVLLAHEFISTDIDEIRADGAPTFIFDKHKSKKRIRASIYKETITPFVLCVGTLTARKNILSVCRVWINIEKELGLETPRLVFVGNNGWLNDDFQSLLVSTGYCNGLVSVVSGPLDHELAYLYRNCLFTVYPSFYEGWGLPIGESLWFKKPVVASETSSMTEVGGNLVDYVDPYSPTDIKRSVMRLITDIDYRNRRIEEISKATLRSWDDVANHQIAVLLQMVRAKATTLPHCGRLG